MMPAVMGIAAKSMNMTTAEFLKAMEQGQITAEKFLPVFTKALRAEAEPGIAKALKTTNVAMKKMIQNGKLLVRALFNAGLGDLFTEIFNMLSDIFRIMEPILALFVSFGTTILRAVIFPIRLAIALVADLIKLIDYAMGGNLTQVMVVLGKIAGFVATIFGSLVKTIRPIFKAFSWMFGKIGQYMPSMKMLDKAKDSYSGVRSAVTGAKDIGSRIKTGSKNALQKADDSRIISAAGVGQGGVDAYGARNEVKTYIEFTGEAKESLRENRNEGSRRSMKSDTRS